MRFHLISTFIFSLIFSSIVSAQDVCVSNAKEFSDRKKDIPSVFHPLLEETIYFTLDKSMGKAGLKVRTNQNGSFVFEGYTLEGSEYHEQDSPVEKICFQNGKVLVDLGPGKKSMEATIEEAGISVRKMGFKILIGASNKNTFEAVKKRALTARAERKNSIDTQAFGVN